jgi:hypothetical protein
LNAFKLKICNRFFFRSVYFSLPSGFLETLHLHSSGIQGKNKVKVSLLMVFSKQVVLCALSSPCRITILAPIRLSWSKERYLSLMINFAVSVLSRLMLCEHFLGHFTIIKTHWTVQLLIGISHSKEFHQTSQKSQSNNGTTTI